MYNKQSLFDADLAKKSPLIKIQRNMTTLEDVELDYMIDFYISLFKNTRKNQDK